MKTEVLDTRTELERLRKLEKSLQSLKLTMSVALLLIIGLLLIGQAKPNPNQKVVAEEFILLDERGNERATLRLGHLGPHQRH